MKQHILGIDPGTRKIGLAVLRSSDGGIVERSIAEIETLDIEIGRLRNTWSIELVAMGNGTNRNLIAQVPALADAHVRLVNEHETSLRARQLYFSENPPTGWRRLIPLGLQVPPVPVDDYAAVIIARRFLSKAVAKDGLEQ